MSMYFRYGSSTGPKILLFKRFQKSWDLIDEENFEINQEFLDNSSASICFVEKCFYNTKAATCTENIACLLV